VKGGPRTGCTDALGQGKKRKRGRLGLDKESEVGGGVRNAWKAREKSTVCRARRGNWD